MNNSSRIKILTASFFILSSFGCDEDEIIPSGNLDRPSGLAYVEYEDGRGDLFVADAEAQGVRVLQLLDNPLQGGSSLKPERQTFVRAPTVQFPLVMPAPRHPTHVTATKTRAYALSTVDSTIHVLDVGPSTFGASATLATNDTYKSLATLPLNAAEFTNALPVALTAVDNGLIVLFDRPQTGDGLLAKLELQDTVISSIETATISSGSPRDLIVRTVQPLAAVVSSAATSSVAIVELNSSGGSAFGAVRYVDVGGSSHRLIDAQDSGVVVIRLDRPAVVILENDAGILKRSSRRFDNDFGIRSPYTPRNETDAELASGDLYGRIDLPNQPVSGAYGLLTSMHPGFAGVDASANMLTACEDQTENSLCEYESEGGSTLSGRCRYDGDQLACSFTGHVPDVIQTADKTTEGQSAVVYLVLADGRDAFLVGNPLRLVKSSASYVEQVALSREDDMTISGCSSVQAPASCSERQVRISCSESAEVSSEVSDSCRGLGTSASACEPSVLSREFLVASSFKAEYRGNLFVESEGRLKAIDTSTQSFRFEHLESRTFDLSTYQIKNGDWIHVQVTKPSIENDACAAQWVDGIESSFHKGLIVDADTNYLDLAFPEATQISNLLTCGIELDISWAEIFPQDEVFVLTELVSSASDKISKVHSRVAIQTSSTASDFVEIDDVLKLRIASDSGFGLDTSCTETEKSRPCTSGSDCESGLCTASLVQDRDGNVCTGTCDDGQAIFERVCSGARFEIVPTLMNSNPVSSCPATDRALLVAAPEDTVFVPNRRSWFTSVPGSRALRETILTDDSYLTCASYR